MTVVVAFLFTVLKHYAIIVQISGDTNMKTIDFEQYGIKRKEAFVMDEFAHTVLNELFPVMKGISNGDIHVINYVIFRGKRLIDVVIRYKDLCLPMALDFSIDSDLERRQIKGYRAFYKFNISISNDKMQSILFDDSRDSDFNVKTFKEFLGGDVERFNILYDSYYNKDNSPMQYKQHVLKTTSMDAYSTNDISFDCEFQYMSETSGFFFNIYSNAIEYKKNVDRVEELSYQLKPMDGIISGKFTTIDFWQTIKDNPSMIAEPFRVAIQKHYNVDDYVIPHFDSHIELFNFYNNEQKRIQEISEMIKI